MIAAPDDRLFIDWAVDPGTTSDTLVTGGWTFRCGEPMLKWSATYRGTPVATARKAFYPSKPLFPLLHVDTTWKFRGMYEFRERMVRESGMDLLVFQNEECLRLGINPFEHGSASHADNVP